MKQVCAGLDIGGTNSHIGLVDQDGNVLFELALPTKQFAGPERFVQAAAECIRTGLSTTNTTLHGIGIGAPNGNFYTGSIVFAPNMPWKGDIPLAAQFEQALGVKTVLTNDANAAALGEQLFGGAKGLRDFVVVTLGTGLGSGFVVNGEVLYGHDGFAGELGHVIVERDGRRCGCGRNGCLETYVSATGLVRTMQEWLGNSAQPSPLRNLPEDQITSKLIAEYARQGETISVEVLAYTAKILGFALANMAAITSPETIFLFGGLAQAGELILAPTKEAMEENLLNIYKGKIKLQISALNGHAAILGAAALAWK